MKKYLSHFIFFQLFLSFTFVCRAQTEQENLNKYFAYRNWLKTRFEKIGPENGESLPIENRSIHPPNNPSNIKIRWGDATVHLGFYIAALATEYKLFMDENNDEAANGTLNELYYAIVALNRIDDFAK